MTSLKKPLIAIATALVIATTAVVAAPANAAVATGLTVNAVATSTDGLTEATAVVLPVPADNAVNVTDAVRIAVTGLDNNATVTATATNAFLVSTVGDSVSASAGNASASVATGTGTSATFYAYTKSTTVGKVVITVGSTTVGTYYVKGTAGALNTIALSAPTAALGTTAKVVVNGTDVFGNPVAGSTVALQVVSGTATNTYSVTTDVHGDATKDLTGLVVGSYDLIATATVATAVTGLPAPAGFVRGTLKVVDLAALVATKDAELAVANATIADLNNKLAIANALADGNKAKYNALATKWNKAHPKSKVALLK
jgi:hypothetical protein